MKITRRVRCIYRNQSCIYRIRECKSQEPSSSLQPQNAEPHRWSRTSGLACCNLLHCLNCILASWLMRLQCQGFDIHFVQLPRHPLRLAPSGLNRRRGTEHEGRNSGIKYFVEIKGFLDISFNFMAKLHLFNDFLILTN